MLLFEMFLLRLDQFTASLLAAEPCLPAEKIQIRMTLHYRITVRLSRNRTSGRAALVQHGSQL